jgi:GNAT superfamily N-acetyltransferase
VRRKPVGRNGKDADVVRQADPDDAASLAWLRATSFGTRRASEDLEACSRAILHDHLRDGDFAAFLIEEGSRPVSYGVTMIHQRLPTPANPGGRWGYIQSLETHPDCRGRGHAGAILTAMLDWHRAEGVGAVNVQASALAESLYLRHGFTDAMEPGGLWLAARW